MESSRRQWPDALDGGPCLGWSGLWPGGSGRGLASLLARSGVGIGLGTGVFQVVGACTQAWVWRLVPGWLLLVDFGRYLLDFFGEGL